MSPTVQDAFWPIPGLISYGGVTGRWGVLSHAQNGMSEVVPIQYLPLDDVSCIFGHLGEAHIRELEACLHARWEREECALIWYHLPHNSGTMTRV